MSKYKLAAVLRCGLILSWAVALAPVLAVAAPVPPAAAAALMQPAAAAALMQPAAAAVVPPDRLLADGLKAFHRGDYAAARASFRILAGRDVAAAETLLGTMAVNGQGGPKDAAVGAAWFMRAARRGYAPAQLALADSFAKGRGVAKNPARAMALAKAAADQQHPGAELWIIQHSAARLASLNR